MKHKLFAFITILLFPVLLAGCVATAPAPAPAAEAAETAAAATADAFPVTIEHKLGSTTISAKPERVVTLGFTDQDYLLALGVVPVGIRDWFGDQPNAVWPWARPLLKGAAPEVLPRELNFEQIAKLQPDLIVAIYTSLTQEEYDLLSQIAPVVTAPAGLADYAITWQEQTRYTGQIVGQTARAEELVTRLEAKIAQARTDHPEFAGTDYAFASVYGGEYYLYGEQSTASRFLTALGFVVPTDILDLTDNANDYLVFSAERMDLVDRSLTLWSEGPNDAGVVALLENPLYTNLAVHTAGRDLFLGLDLYGGAFSFSSVLSLDLLVDDLVPALALALDGDPATAPVLGATAATSATRTVTDDLGRTVEVPAQPQRIVALQDLQVLRPLLDLGVNPIASTTHPAYEGAFRFVDEYDVSAIEPVGLLGEPNLEQLVLLKPDLIIGTLSAGTDGQLEQLSAIAPTLVYNAGRPVIEYHRSLAEAVGAVEAYEALMADYETRLADLRAKLAPISTDLTVSLLAFNPNAGQIEIGEGPYTLVLRGAGINQPDPQVNFESADEGVRRYWISPELLPEHDADLIFLLYTRDPAVNAPITDSAIWATLKAVQAGQVVEINGATWYVQSVRSLFSVIDAMAQHLVEATVDTTVFE